ncbi:hypothetical protein D9M72_451370 [compost metagenome]
MLDQIERIDDVAKRLRHLLALVEQEAMGKDALGQRQAGRYQESRPIDCVEADDVLADHMDVGWPELGAWTLGIVEIAGRGDVVRQRVDPDIHHVRRVVRNLDAPVEGGARNREILEARFHERNHLVAAFGRTDEIRIFLIVLQELVLIGGEAEEVALLLDPFDGRSLRAVADAIVAQFGLVLLVVGFVPHRVPAGVGILVEVARLAHANPDVLRRIVMALLGRADEVVVGRIQ